MHASGLRAPRSAGEIDRERHGLSFNPDAVQAIRAAKSSVKAGRNTVLHKATRFVSELMKAGETTAAHSLR